MKISLNKYSIRLILLIILICFLLPFNIALIITTNQSSSLFRQYINDSDSNTLNQNSIRLSDEMKQIESYISEGFSANPNLDQAVITYDTVNSKTAIAKWLSSFDTQMLNLDYEPYAYVYDTSNDKIIISYTHPIPGLPTTDSIYNLYHATESITGSDDWEIIELEGIRFLFRNHSYKTLVLGSLIPIDSIQQSVINSYQYNSISCDVNYSADIQESESDRSLIRSELVDSDLILWVSMDSSEILDKLPQLQNILFLVVCMFSLLIPALFFALNGLVIKPLHLIDTALKEVDNGSTEYRIAHYNSAKEFNDINNSFNNMIDNLVHLKLESYENKLQMQRHEMLNLQLQIKPHFLYNSFNDISSLATLHDFEGIKKMMKNLSDYFRYSVRTGYHLVPLERELHFLEAYLNIMEIRYPGCFEFESDYDEELNGLLIPPLLLHTFVENIMTHVVKVGSFTTITFTAHRDDDMVLIEIKDDGEGITPDMLDQIIKKKKLEDEFGKEHVGIWNCYKRLEYFYNGRAHMHIDSVLSEGTIVSIKVPFATEESEIIIEENRIMKKEGAKS